MNYRSKGWPINSSPSDIDAAAPPPFFFSSSSFILAGREELPVVASGRPLCHSQIHLHFFKTAVVCASTQPMQQRKRFLSPFWLQNKRCLLCLSSSLLHLSVTTLSQSKCAAADNCMKHENREEGNLWPGSKPCDCSLDASLHILFIQREWKRERFWIFATWKRSAVDDPSFLLFFFPPLLLFFALFPVVTGVSENIKNHHSLCIKIAIKNKNKAPSPSPCHIAFVSTCDLDPPPFLPHWPPLSAWCVVLYFWTHTKKKITHYWSLVHLGTPWLQSKHN